jgi:Putative transmembrane protein (PGPGW)
MPEPRPQPRAQPSEAPHNPPQERHTTASAPARAREHSLGQLVAGEWKAVRADRAGRRFCNHYSRMREPGRASLRALALVVGPLLVAIGVVLLFIPGPGLIVIALGAAFLCGQSRKLARGLDRAEPRLHRAIARGRRTWQKLRPRP